MKRIRSDESESGPEAKKIKMEYVVWSTWFFIARRPPRRPLRWRPCTDRRHEHDVAEHRHRLAAHTIYTNSCPVQAIS
jgi:hypothetical protein